MAMSGNNLGVMMEGFIVAPYSTSYTFSTFSDDASEVWAALRPNTQSSLRKVVELTGCCRKVQGSVSVTWQKGRTYYIRAYVKEGGGAEYGRIGITPTGHKEISPIPVSMFRKL